MVFSYKLARKMLGLHVSYYLELLRDMKRRESPLNNTSSRPWPVDSS